MKRKLLSDCLNIARRINNPKKHIQFHFYKHFTAIVQEGKIIEYSTNYPGNPINRYYQNWQKIHSECMAFKRAKGLLKKDKPFDVINIRLDKSGGLKLSKPCICCLNYLKAVSNDKVSIYYTNEIGGFSKVII